MTLDEIKNIAFNHPDQIEINWDMLDSDPKYKEDFEDVVTKALMLLPGIEIIHSKLIEGEHITIEGESTSLNPEQVEEYKELVEEELFSGYQMLEMYSRYLAVQNVIKA